MKILAAITKPEAIRKILDHLGIPSEAPRRTGARPPPQAEHPRMADTADVDYADPPSRVTTRQAVQSLPGACNRCRHRTIGRSAAARRHE